MNNFELAVLHHRRIVGEIFEFFSKFIMMESKMINGSAVCSGHKTRILPVNTSDFGHFKDPATLETWQLPTDEVSLAPLREAAKHLKSSSIPVGFPTETVYGLGADAKRSNAVKGIYAAKGRPSDNPLIIHICDLTMLRTLLSPPEPNIDSIPDIYKPLIKKFWPGPLTILLPNPSHSKLAPEVTAGLPTFGARMPNSPLALSLIHLAGVPLAAPSANASTKPSPTTAAHVLHDLDGRIEIILDGGPCQVGVESTVVDGLCNPPVVLRPGGVSIDRIRECEGWECVVTGYKDTSEIGQDAPRAPGMKYKHYSPKAKVVLYEASSKNPVKGQEIEGQNPEEVPIVMEVKDRILEHLEFQLSEDIASIGIVRTKSWGEWAGLGHASLSTEVELCTRMLHSSPITSGNEFTVQQGELWEGSNSPASNAVTLLNGDIPDRHMANVIEISLGKEVGDIAHGLFSALRELDHRGVDVIYVEGIEDEGDIAAAVMNRLRKAAAEIEK